MLRCAVALLQVILLMMYELERLREQEPLLFCRGYFNVKNLIKECPDLILKDVNCTSKIHQMMLFGCIEIRNIAENFLGSYMFP